MFALRLDRRAHQRHPMVLVVVGDEAQGLVLVDDVTVQDGAVPVAHLIRLTRLENDVGELWTRGHGAPICRRRAFIGAPLWRGTQRSSDM